MKRLSIIKIFSGLAVILWLIVIFYLSHQPAAVSNELSTSVTEDIVQKAEKLAPDKDFDVNKLNRTVRKNAHFFTFFVLGVLVLFTIRRVGMKGFRSVAASLVICILCAVIDEVHQLFVPGRGAEVKDVLIDSAGAAVGVMLYMMVGGIGRKRRRRADHEVSL